MIERAAPVAVVGAGTMGAGIAQVAAVAGHPVIVYDAAEGAAARAVAAVRDRVARLVQKGRLDVDPVDPAPGGGRRARRAGPGRVRDRGGGRGPGRQAGPVRRPGEGRRAGLRAGHEHLLAVADRDRGRAQPPRAPGGPAFLQPGAGDAAGRGGQRPGHRPGRGGGRHQAGAGLGQAGRPGVRDTRVHREPGSAAVLRRGAAAGRGAGRQPGHHRRRADPRRAGSGWGRSR